MDSQKSISELSTLRQILSNESTRLNEQIRYLDTAIKLLIDGYSTDQTRIDTEIQIAKAGIAKEMAFKDDKIISLENSLANTQPEKILQIQR